MDATHAQVRWIGRRLLQFSLRTLVVVMALACVGAAMYGWRKRREEQKAQLVEQVIRAMDDREFERASVIAEGAVRQFPGEDVIRAMLEQVRFVRRLERGERVESTTVCF